MRSPLFALLTILTLVTAILLSGCGDWTDTQQSRIIISGRPVDEKVVLDAVSSILGPDDLRPLAIWFSDKPFSKNDGLYWCQDSVIWVYFPESTKCVFDTLFVHELFHHLQARYDGCPSTGLGHPKEIFGNYTPENPVVDGLVKIMNDILREKWCSNCSDKKLVQDTYSVYFRQLIGGENTPITEMEVQINSAFNLTSQIIEQTTPGAFCETIYSNSSLQQCSIEASETCTYGPEHNTLEIECSYTFGPGLDSKSMVPDSGLCEITRYSQTGELEHTGTYFISFQKID